MGDGVLYGRFSVQLNNFRRNSMQASTPCLDKAPSTTMYPVSNTEHPRLSYCFHRYFIGHQIPIHLIVVAQRTDTNGNSMWQTWDVASIIKAKSARLTIAGHSFFDPLQSLHPNLHPAILPLRERKKKGGYKAHGTQKAAHQYQKKNI